MATKKQKRADAIAKRAAFDAEVRESGLAFLRKDQEQRKAKAEADAQAILDRKKETSKRLAKQHKQGIKTHKKAPVDKLPRVAVQPAYDAGLA